MKIAIIGAGISGLVAARNLHARHQLTIFEANSYPGGHTHTVDVLDNGGKRAIDTGFIVYNERNYPRFSQLLEDLGVKTQSTEMSFSVRDDSSGLEYNGHSLSTLFAQRINLFRPSFFRLISEMLRFNRLANRILTGAIEDQNPENSGQIDRETMWFDVTVGEFLEQFRFSNAFRRLYLLPMGAAIWSCSPARFANFPIRFVLDFFFNHGLLQIRGRPQWRVVCGGSREYVNKLIVGFRDQIRLKTPVQRLLRQEDGVDLQMENGELARFDHVIFACHSDQALRILGDSASDVERSALAAIPFTANSVILHTDTGLLPRCRRAWASWNFLTGTRSGRQKVTTLHHGSDDGDPPMVTYYMNRLQGIRSKTNYLVSLNAEHLIRPDRVLQKFVYHHPLFSAAKQKSESLHQRLLNHQRVSYCGAYWKNGFHEDGVASALSVVEAINGIEKFAPNPQKGFPAAGCLT